MEFKSFWLQTLFLLFYFSIIFINSRIFDAMLWLMYRKTPMHVVDPAILSVRQLKTILDNKGVSYVGCIEKQELVRLIKESANVIEKDIEEMRKVEHQLAENENFKESGDFYELVEDADDSVWLIQVVPNSYGNTSFLNYNQWNDICNYVFRFSIRLGLYNCAKDNWLCLTTGWDQPWLLLSFPENIVERKLFQKKFDSNKQRQSIIIRWIRDKMSMELYNVTSIQEMQDDWLSLQSSAAETIKVLLMTHLINPPLFLSVLSAKFAGRIKFGMLSLKQQNYALLNNKLIAPVNLIVYQKRVLVVGTRKPQYISFKSMNVFLRVLQPEINDVFLVSLVLINMLACFKIFQILQDISLDNARFWDVGRIIWTAVSINIQLLSTWILLVSINQWPIMIFLSNIAIWLLQRFLLTDIGTLILSDCLSLFEFPIIFFSTFLAYSYIFTGVLKHVPSMRGVNTSRNTSNNNAQNWSGDILPTEWFIFDSLFRFRLFSPIDEENERQNENIISRVPIVNFWITPSIPNDYVKDLPVWPFTISQMNKEIEAVKNLLNHTNIDCLTEPSYNTCSARTKCTSRQMECKLINGGRYRNYCTECLKSIQCYNYANIIMSSDCSVCLDTYVPDVLLCGLPCGHAFHKICIYTWLERDNHHCPICRWPAYKYFR